MKEKKMEEAVSAVTFLIGFMTILGYDPKATQKLGKWVNEIPRDDEFTQNVEQTLNGLEDLQSFLQEMLKLNADVIAEEMEALHQQVQELRQLQQDKQARINDAEVDGRCSYCFRKAGQGGCMGRHTGHPAKAPKTHK